MDILAVYPQEPELAVFEKMPPLGMIWIGTTLQRAGYDLMFIDQQVDDRDPGRVAEETRPRLALVGGTTHSRFASFAVARSIKQASTGTIVVYGGPHASFTAEDTLGHVSSIDLVVHGEGEETCLDLASWAKQNGARIEELARVQGISYRDNGAIVHNDPRPVIQDLDDLGTPDRGLVPLDRYRMQMDYLGIPGTSVMTARGCPIGCTFCSASAMFGKTYRSRSPKLVVDEIEGLVSEHGVRGIKIFDSTFTLNRKHALGFCNELVRRGLKIPWECEIRVGSVDKRLLAIMRDAGCYYVDVGIESGSQRVLDECVRKAISLDDAELLLRWSQELGLLTKVFFTVGHPGETVEEAQMTNRFIWKNRRTIRLAAYHAGLRIYPGTYMERYAQENDLLPAGFRWSAPYQNLANRRLLRSVDNVPILLQPGLQLEDLRRLRILFIACRLVSPRYLLEKARSILGQNSLFAYVMIIAHGLRIRGRKRWAGRRA